MLKITRKDRAWLRSASKKVKKTNTAFAKATKKQKRVLIAKDNISLLLIEAIDPRQGVYFRLASKVANAPLNIKAGEQVQALVGDATSKQFPNCVVCAIGGAMLSTIRLANKITFQGLGEVTDHTRAIDDAIEGAVLETGWTRNKAVWNTGRTIKVAPWVGIFGHDMLRSMEHVFEQHSSCPMSDISGPVLRMFAIMENIIVNKGNFNPPSFEEYDGLPKYLSTEEVGKRFKAMKKMMASKN